MNEGQIFIVYAIAWGILAIVFTVLKKKAKEIKKKKMITLIGSLSILTLMFGIALWMGCPLKALSLFFAFALVIVFVAQK